MDPFSSLLCSCLVNSHGTICMCVAHVYVCVCVHASGLGSICHSKKDTHGTLIPIWETAAVNTEKGKEQDSFGRAFPSFY